MRRALFAREFRTALVPNLVTVGAILGTLVVLAKLLGPKLGKAEDLRVFTDVGLLACLVVSGFISGERCFPTELKESRLLFLSSLPISHSWIWLTIVSARLLAALASMALVFAIRQPRLIFEESKVLLQLDMGLGAAMLFLGYALFFSVGALFALLFRRTLFSYAVGFPVLGLLLIETLFSCSYSIWLPNILLLSQSPRTFDGWRPPPFLMAFLSLLLVSLFLLSWRLFVRGEIGNPKRRIGNQILFAMAAAVYLGFVFSVAASPRLAWIGSTSGSDENRIAQDRPLPYGVSPDGRYLFAFESVDRRPFMVRVSIVDTGSGRIIGRSFYGGAGWGYWSEHGDVLNLLVLNNSPLDRWGYLVPGTVDFIRISPEAREVSRLRFKGVEDVTTLAEGRALVVLRDGNLGKILLLDGASGRSSELARAPLDGQLIVNDDGESALVFFDNILLRRRAWAIDSLAREVRVPRLSLKTPYFIFGESFGSPAEAQKTLLQRFGQPSTHGGALVRGSLLLPDPRRALILTQPPGLYFLEERVPASRVVLWARSTAPEGRWGKLPDLAPQLSPLFEQGVQESFIDFASGVGAFLTLDGDASRFLVYDPRFGVIESEGCAPKDKLFLDLNRVRGLKGLLVRVLCADKASPSRSQTRYFEYLPGSGKMLAIKTVATWPIISWPELYLDERGREIYVSYGESRRYEIWRSSPGTKDLRLWPPR
jgi:hypothetical protein